MRSTKIVATLGPASDDRIDELVDHGVDVFRINFSHGSHLEHGERIAAIRRAADRAGCFVAILADLQGPKIRICGFADGDGVELRAGAPFVIDAALGEHDGNGERVGTTYRALADEVRSGDVLVLGDGLIELEVEHCRGSAVHSCVRVGGLLGAKKGINKRGGGLSAPALTDKDEKDLTFACAAGVDYIAVSFPRNAEDMDTARQMVRGLGASCGLVAKIERAEAIADDQALDALIRASDAVMVARGDLGIEIGDAALMGVQKHLIARARDLNRSVITATQMMETMITNPRPTRAEVMDVANAVLDGTDAVMLSGETAVGAYPVDTVDLMTRVIEGAEASVHFTDRPLPSRSFDAIDEAVALAARTVAEHLTGVRAVICLTSSGNTPRLMSRIRSRMPVYALADNPRTLARVALFRGVHPVLFETDHIDDDLVNDYAIRLLQDDGVVVSGDRVIVSKGDFRNVQGGTNTLKIMTVP